jgi:hypothetical protein
MAVTINGTNGITFNNSSTQAQSAGLGSSATAQTWQNVTGSRAFTTTYTNSTGYPIMVNIYSTGGGSGQITLNIGGVAVATAAVAGLAGGLFTLSGIVPNGATYSLTNPGGGGFAFWGELR